MSPWLIGPLILIGAVVCGGLYTAAAREFGWRTDRC